MTATGAIAVGGLVGTSTAKFRFGTITNSSASGPVSSSDGGPDNFFGGLGGLVGLNAAGTITNSHATGTVTGGANCSECGRARWQQLRRRDHELRRDRQRERRVEQHSRRLRRLQHQRLCWGRRPANAHRLARDRQRHRRRQQHRGRLLRGQSVRRHRQFLRHRRGQRRHRQHRGRLRRPQYRHGQRRLCDRSGQRRRQQLRRRVPRRQFRGCGRQLRGSGRSRFAVLRARRRHRRRQQLRRRICRDQRRQPRPDLCGRAGDRRPGQHHGRPRRLEFIQLHFAARDRAARPAGDRHQFVLGSADHRSEHQRRRHPRRYRPARARTAVGIRSGRMGNQRRAVSLPGGARSIGHDPRAARAAAHAAAAGAAGHPPVPPTGPPPTAEVPPAVLQQQVAQEFRPQAALAAVTDGRGRQHAGRHRPLQQAQGQPQGQRGPSGAAEPVRAPRRRRRRSRSG